MSGDEKEKKMNPDEGEKTVNPDDGDKTVNPDKGDKTKSEDEGEKFPFKNPARGHHGKAFLFMPYTMQMRRSRLPRWACMRREFSKVDLPNFERVLPDWGYDINTTHPPNKDELLKWFDELANTNFDDCDSILIIISIYGQHDMLFWEGGVVKVKDLLERLLPSKAPNIANIPKLVVFQICNPVDFTFHESDPCPHYNAELGDIGQTLTTGSNLAVIQCLFPGRTLWRKGEHGSMFLGYFSEALEEAEGPIDIQKIYYNACDMVDEELTLQAEDWYSVSGHPLPIMISSFTKRFVLERKKEVKEEEKKEEKMDADEGAEKKEGDSAESGDKPTAGPSDKPDASSGDQPTAGTSDQTSSGSDTKMQVDEKSETAPEKMEE